MRLLLFFARLSSNDFRRKGGQVKSRRQWGWLRVCVCVWA